MRPCNNCEIRVSSLSLMEVGENQRRSACSSRKVPLHGEPKPVKREKTPKSIAAMKRKKRAIVSTLLHLLLIRSNIYRYTMNVWPWHYSRRDLILMQFVFNNDTNRITNHFADVCVQLCICVYTEQEKRQNNTSNSLCLCSVLPLLQEVLLH